MPGKKKPTEPAENASESAAKKARSESAAKAESAGQTADVVPAAKVAPPAALRNNVLSSGSVQGSGSNAHSHQEWTDMCKGVAHTKHTWKIARLVLPYVKTNLPIALRSLNMQVPDDLCQVEPLQIQGEPGHGLSNFKEVWRPANCQTSITSTGLYEASGNLMWLDMMIAGGHELPLQEPVWSVVLEYVDDFFSEAAVDSNKEQYNSRLVFPLTLEGYAKQEEQLYAGGAGNVGKTYPTKVTLLIGHAVVLAWYYAMAVALKDNNVALIKLLWQAALTVTIRVRLSSSVETLLRASMMESEKFKGFEKMSDNLLTFADKFALLAGQAKEHSASKLAETFAADGLKFAGGIINKQMMLTVQALQSNMSDALRQCLVQIEIQFGRDVLTASYTKLNRVMAVTKTMAPIVGATGAEDGKMLLLFVCQMLALSLQTKQAKSNFFTIAVLDNNKNGTIGWTAMTCAKFAALRHLEYLLKCLNMPEVFVTKYITAFGFPVSFTTQFPSLVESLSAETTEADEKPESLPDDEVSAFEQFCNGMSKLQTSICTLANGIYMGERDADLKTLAAEANPLATLQKLDAEQDSDLCAAYREIMRLASSTQTINASSGSTPALSLRVLARMQSDPDALETSRDKIEEERASIWKKAKDHRKKFAHVVVCKTKTSAAMNAAVKRATAFQSFKAKINESHRAYILSLDLLFEADKEPWKTVPEMQKSLFQYILDFLQGCCGSTDFVFAFDGRCRKMRGALDEALSGDGKEPSEMWVIYDASSSTSLGQRETCLSSINKEMALIRLPIMRTRLEVKERSGGGSAGSESSTYFATRSGVPLPCPRKLPRITTTDKTEIMKSGDEIPKKWKEEGVPLFWRESKTQSFWEHLIDDFDLGAICDCSPGSGALAAAAMQKGCQYLGICQSEKHSVWVSNIIDRSAMRSIVDSSTQLHEQDLAQHISEHFSELLEDDDVAADDEDTFSDFDE